MIQMIVMMIKKLNSFINFVLMKYTLLENYISRMTLFILHKNYIKTSIIFSIFFDILSISILYFILILVNCITLCYYLFKKDFKNAFKFFYKYIFLRLLFLLLIKYLNTLVLIPIYLLYRISIYIYNNKPPSNLVSFIIYIGTFIRQPIYKLKTEILTNCSILKI